jgi:hypothetical protein
MSFAQLILGAGVSAAEDLDQPTHAEVEPIRFEIGLDGKIETMAMDHKGRLLCGVSWSTDQAAAADQPARLAFPRKKPTRPHAARHKGRFPGICAADRKPRHSKTSMMAPTNTPSKCWTAKGKFWRRGP